MDFIKGGRVATYLDRIEKINHNSSEAEVLAYQRNELQSLLKHARETVPLFSKQTSLNINDWPITNKMTYRDHYESCISKKYDHASLIEMATSGSTGTPFISYQDRTKKKHVNAETMFYNGHVGYQIGKRIIYLRSVVNEVQKSSLQQFCQNIYLVDCNDLSDSGIKEKLSSIVSLSKGYGAMMMGYASTFEAFHKYFEKYGMGEVAAAKIYGIVSGSEMLYDPVRETMEKAFRCKCVSRYANEENGFLGQDSDENNVFYLNRADYYFEILKMDQDIAAEEGEIGRIILTDLFNYAMPMIRYDTGDVGALVKRKKDGITRTVLVSFGGRKVDTITDCEGNLLSPHAITNLMWKYNTVKQYQFVQHGIGDYTLKINPEQERNITDSLIEDYKRILGSTARILLKYCNDIPVLASGKRRYIVNEMKL